MTDVITLAAERRPNTGKGAARATRRSGRLPAVIYGGGEDPMAVSIDPVELQKQLRGHGFFSRVLEVDLGGTRHRVLPRDLQRDPVSGVPTHIDFFRVLATSKVEVEVEVVFENEAECAGLRTGGVLNVVLHALPLICRADHIPQQIAVDLKGLAIGDAIHLRDIPLPGDVQVKIDDLDMTVASIAAPTVARAEEAAGEEAAEPAAETAERAGREE
jgi:large subunit ribosomal protein L25